MRVQSSLQLFGSSTGAVIGSLQWKTLPASPWFVAWVDVEGWCTLLSVLACLSGVLCCLRIGSKSFKNSLFGSVRLPDRVSCQFVRFSSGMVAKCLCSVCSVHKLFQPWLPGKSLLAHNQQLSECALLKGPQMFYGVVV